MKINKNGKEYDLGFVPQSLYDDVEDLKDAVNDKVSKSGDTITGLVTISQANTDTPLYLKGDSNGGFIGFKTSDNTSVGYIGVKNDGKPYFYKNSAKEIALKEDLTKKVAGWHFAIYINISDGNFEIFCPYNVQDKGVPTVTQLDVSYVGTFNTNIRVTKNRPNGFTVTSDNLPQNSNYAGRVCSVYIVTS